VRWWIAAALAVLVMTAVSGTVAGLAGSTTAAVLIWTAGGLASVSILFVAPWVIRCVGNVDSEGD